MFIAPPQRIISLALMNSFFLPKSVLNVTSTPTAVFPSKTTFSTMARVLIVRFLRLFTGCKYARDEESLLPLLTFRSKGPKPSWR